MADEKGRLNVSRLTKTKIVCTLGPSTSKEDVLEKMIKVGMDVIRLNFSHGNHEEHKQLFETVRKLGEKYQHQISIICDIQGPKIRTGVMEKQFTVNAGDKIDITPDEVKGNKNLIQIKYDKLLEDISEKDVIFINDGIIKLVVEKKNEKTLTCVVETGGTISDHKGVNIPSDNLTVNLVTPKDREDLKLIAKLNPEYVASSFIGTAEDVEKIRNVLKEYGNSDIKIISKIERPLALTNLDSIMKVTDAVMVARGDLGVEIDTWDIPICQKEICSKCNAAGKPVIVATQMLESMTEVSRPTRAETTDVYNAVLDGADAVMLSGETSIGKYPVETVQVMDKIVKAAEAQMKRIIDHTKASPGMTETIASGTYHMAALFPLLNYTGKIIVITGRPSGYVARMVSKHRPNLDILVITDDLRTARELNLVWGVRTIYDECLKGITDAEYRNVRAIEKAHDMDLLSLSDYALVVSRSLLGTHVGSSTSIYSVKAIIEKTTNTQ